MHMLLQYMDRLSSERQEVFSKLKSFSPQFVLAGGTAIMLQIGHRLSFDFDCFSDNILPNTLLYKTKKIFGRFIKIEFQTSEIIAIKNQKGVEISFVWHPYKALRSPLQTESISLFHLDDLVTNKALTIGRRGAWRDYIDLFFFLKWNLYDLEEIINLSLKRFGGEFNEKLFLQQLVYFDDLKIVPTTFLKESYTDKEIQSYLEKEVESYLAKLLG